MSGGVNNIPIIKNSLIMYGLALTIDFFDAIPLLINIIVDIRTVLIIVCY